MHRRLLPPDSARRGAGDAVQRHGGALRARGARLQHHLHERRRHVQSIIARSRGENTSPFHPLLKCTPEMCGKPVSRRPARTDGARSAQPVPASRQPTAAARRSQACRVPPRVPYACPAHDAGSPGCTCSHASAPPTASRPCARVRACAGGGRAWCRMSAFGRRSAAQ
jgi:hypothetical protein